MNERTIEIQPYSFGPRGEANRFEVQTFAGGVHQQATFTTRVFRAAQEQQVNINGEITQAAAPEVDLGNVMVNVTLEQWNQWLDDKEFFRLLAILAGFTPVEIV